MWDEVMLVIELIGQLFKTMLLGAVFLLASGVVLDLWDFRVTVWRNRGKDEWPGDDS